MVCLTPSGPLTSVRRHSSRVTRSPLAIASFAIALQISPCTRTRPGVPGAIGSSACPVSPISPSTPVTGAARCDASASRTRNAAIAVNPSTTDRMRLRLSCSSGAGESISISDPKIRLMMPPIVSSP